MTNHEEYGNVLFAPRCTCGEISSDHWWYNEELHGCHNGPCEQYVPVHKNSSVSDIETNENGGMQSAIGTAFHLLPPKAMFALARVFAEGAKKYAPDNWRLIPIAEHINHGINHDYLYLANDTTEEHLAHAAARALMALEMYLEAQNVN